MRTAVELAGPDGTLRGERIGAGRWWVVLVHDLGEDLDAWRTLPEDLAAVGLTVLAIDLRGHGGSDGVAAPTVVAADGDIAAVVRYARAHGARGLLLVGAGRTGALALRHPAADAAVAISPRLTDALSPGGRAARPIPRMLVVAARDPACDADATALAAMMFPPPTVARLPIAAAGLDALDGAWGSNIRAYVEAFAEARQTKRGEPACR